MYHDNLFRAEWTLIKKLWWSQMAAVLYYLHLAAFEEMSTVFLSVCLFRSEQKMIRKRKAIIIRNLFDLGKQKRFSPYELNFWIKYNKVAMKTQKPFSRIIWHLVLFGIRKWTKTKKVEWSQSFVCIFNFFLLKDAHVPVCFSSSSVDVSE